MYTRVVRPLLFSRAGHVAAARSGLAALSLAALCFQHIPASSAPARTPVKVSAVYAITFNGFNIGSFKFDSEVDGKRYTLRGDAELSALLGAFKWRGISLASGRVGRRGPKPSDYLLSFKGTSRNGSIKVGFDRKGVNSASIVPPIPVMPDEVPLQRKHLKGALDPLTAVMALTIGSSKKPCNQTLSIFDGKQRFDLKLAYRGQRASQWFPGQPGPATAKMVCSVKYKPLGGYRMTSQTKLLAQSDGLEIAMLPVPSANVAVPHEIRIPTGYGDIVLTAEKVSLTDRNQRRLALLGGR